MYGCCLIIYHRYYRWAANIGEYVFEQEIYCGSFRLLHSVLVVHLECARRVCEGKEVKNGFPAFI